MPEFEKTLKDMVQQYPETRLIIIDVLAKVEQPSRGRGKLPGRLCGNVAVPAFCFDPRYRGE